MILRPYQQHSIECILREFETHQSTLLVHATGLGKTVLSADLIRRFQPLRTLFICEREELIYQAKDKIQIVTGLKGQIEMAEHWSNDNLFERAPVIVATVQTLNSKWGDKLRMHRLKPTDFGLILCDEAHHSAAFRYRRTFDYFYEGNPNIKLLGVTATPLRHDKKALGDIYESVADQYEIADAIRDGWLVDISQEAIFVKGLDYSGIRTINGDLDGQELARVLEVEDIVQRMVHPSLEVIFGVKPRKTLNTIPQEDWAGWLRKWGPARRTIYFSASVAQAEMAAKIFNRAVPGIADWVCGETSKENRAMILDRFRSGEVPVLCNFGITVEGFDLPAVEIILQGRPTKSQSLFVQMLGRATRPLPGVVDGLATADAQARLDAIKASSKKFCRSVDYVGNTGRHTLIRAAHVLSGNYSDDVVEAALADADKRGAPVMIAVTLSNAQKELQRQKLKAAEEARRAEEERKRGYVAKTDYESEAVDLFADGHLKAQKFHKPKTKIPATAKQIKLIAWKWKCNASEWSKSMAGWFIGLCKGNGDRIPDTAKWVKDKYGFPSV